MMGKHWLCELLGHKFKYLKPWFVCERCGYHFHNPYPPQGNIPPPNTIDHDVLLNVTANQHHAEVHGADKHTNVTRELFIPANEGHIMAGTSDFIGSYGAVSGLDNFEEPRVYFTIKVPDDFVSFISLKPVWLCTAGSGNMYWELIASYGAAGEFYGMHSDDTTFGVSATGGTNIINVSDHPTPLTLANLAKSDYLGITFYRDGMHANDTLNATVYLLGLFFTYTAEQ